MRSALWKRMVESHPKYVSYAKWDNKIFNYNTPMVEMLGNPIFLTINLTKIQ